MKGFFNRRQAVFQHFAPLVDEIKDEQTLIKERLDQLVVHSRLNEKFERISHPYFEKIAKEKLDEFFADNRDLFDGVYYTDLYDANSFFPNGLEYTSHGGKIRATCNAWSLKESFWGGLHLEKQKQLIKEKRVTIQRIFILTEEEFRDNMPMLEAQHLIKIQVYVIFKPKKKSGSKENAPRVPKEWLHNDFMLLENALLIELEENNKALLSLLNQQQKREGKEKIKMPIKMTTCKSIITEKENRFDTMLEWAVTFEQACARFEDMANVAGE